MPLFITINQFTNLPVNILPELYKDLMIEDELETSDPKTYCGEDRSLDKEYIL